MSTDVNHNDSIASKEQSSLTQFRSLLESHKKTKGFQPDDKFLSKFLRSRDFEPEEALKVLIAYISAINDQPEIFTWNDAIEKVIQSGVHRPYPVKNIDGSKIVICSPGKWNPSEYSCEIYLAHVVFAIEATLLDEEIQKNGVILVYDMRGLGWNQLYNFGLSKGKLNSDVIDKIIPWKINSIHMIHENRLTGAAFTLYKPFLGGKLRSRINFHGHDLEKFYQIVPKEHLPPSLGGTNQEFTTNYYDQLILKHKDTVLAMWNFFKDKRERSK